MAQGERQRPRGSMIVLVVALALAAGALGWTFWRTPGPGPAATPSAATSDPIAALEARTRTTPGDATAWSALAIAEFETGRFVAAADTFGKALSLSPDRAALWSSRGEARVMASERDPLPAAALADFAKALALDPKDPRARYFMAVKRDLDGDHAGAIADWLALLADTPPGAPWEADLRRTIEQVGKINGIAVADRLGQLRQPAATAPVAVRAIPGPDAGDLASAARLRPAEQRVMAEGMVARLEGKLQSNPVNPDGWIMLIRSRVTLGQPDKAAQALRDAVAANPGAERSLREQAGLLGVG